MGKFQIKTPDGFEVEVDAKTEAEALDKAKAGWQTMPRIIARGDGNVRVFQRSNGQKYLVAPGYSTTDPAAIEKVLGGQTAGDVSKQSIDQSIIEQNPISARVNEVARGTPFVGSYVDEAMGVFGPQATAGSRALTGAMQREKPGETLGLNIAGGLLGGGAAAAAAGPAIGGAVGSAIGQGSRLSRVARGLAAGSAAGATEGLVYGFGEGTDGQDRLEQAGGSAAIGGTFGGLLGGLGPIVGDAAQNVIGRFRRSDIGTISKEFGISEDAAKVIKNTFDQGGDIQAAEAALRKAGKEAMLVDAGPAAQALLDASAQSGGRAGQDVTEAVTGRMARTGQAVDATLDATLGPAPLGPKTAMDTIAEASRVPRTEAYGLAYSTPINYATGEGMAIEDVLSRIEPDVIMSAVKEANADMLARGVKNQQIMASIAPDGSVIYREMPNVQQLDELKKALQALAYSPANMNQVTGKLTGTGQRYNALAGQLRDAVEKTVPEYGAAVKIGGDKLAEERAFILGRDLLRPGTEVEDVFLELGKKPSADQLAAAKQGLRSYIAKALGDVRAIASDPGADALDARQVVKAVSDLSSDNARKKVRDLLGKEADVILSQIDEAAQSATVRASLAQNSKTAARQAVQGTIEEITAPGAIGKAGMGEAIDATKSMVQAATGMNSEFTAAQRQKVYQDIAKALTQKKGPEAMAALRVLDAAIKGQNLTESQSAQLANMIATAIYGAGTTGATRGATAENRQNGQR